MSDSQVKKALQQKRQTNDPFCVHYERRPNFVSFSLLDANLWRQRSLGRLDGEEEDSKAHRGSTAARARVGAKASEGGRSRALEAMAGHNRLSKANPRPANDDDDEQRVASRTAWSNRARAHRIELGARQIYDAQPARSSPTWRGRRRLAGRRCVWLFCVWLLEIKSFWVSNLCAWETQRDKCLSNLGADGWRQSKLEETIGPVTGNGAAVNAHAYEEPGGRLGTS